MDPRWYKRDPPTGTDITPTRLESLGLSAATRTKPGKILELMPRESAAYSHRITRLLRAWGQGDDAALAELTPLVHAELRTLARGYMKDERRDHTLQATALVNECFMRLMDTRQVEWQDRAHFFALSARLMRRILVDVARARRYDKRRGGAEHVPLDESVPAAEPGRDLVALDDALQSLATIDERKSHVVELRFFGGLSHEETAEILGVSAKTVMREWQVAKMWLLRELRQRDSPGRLGSGG